jgi:hypothetical protein
MQAVAAQVRDSPPGSSAMPRLSRIPRDICSPNGIGDLDLPCRVASMLSVIYGLMPAAICTEKLNLSPLAYAQLAGLTPRVAPARRRQEPGMRGKRSLWGQSSGVQWRGEATRGNDLRRDSSRGRNGEETRRTGCARSVEQPPWAVLCAGLLGFSMDSAGEAASCRAPAQITVVILFSGLVYSRSQVWAEGRRDLPIRARPGSPGPTAEEPD